MKRRLGFTILELLTVIVIVGLLATIAISRFWSVKERSYRAAVKNDLHTAALQQEAYFHKNMTYAPDANALADFVPSQGVTITVTWSDQTGWAATAVHTSLTGEQCGYFTGPAAAGIASPATQPGAVKCTE